MCRKQGLTLIEMLITSSIIAVLTAVALPGLRNARTTANENSAITTLHAFVQALETYRVRFGTIPDSFADLEGAGIVDEVLGSLDTGNPKSGYLYSYSQDANSWQIWADPWEPGLTGHRYFFVDASGVLRHEESRPADSSSPAIE